MYPSSNGKMYFSDVNEMYYELFLEIGLGVNSSQYIYDQDTGIVLKYKDKHIKMNFNNNVYAGNNDIVFDPSTNYNLMVTLFGYYIEKETNEGKNIGYIAQFTEDDQSKAFVAKGERFKQRVFRRSRSAFILSISIGPIEYNSKHNDLNALLKEADKNLYEEKKIKHAQRDLLKGKE